MSKRRDTLPRLNVNPNLSLQQPMGGPGQPLYSPALPTSLQQSFHPSFPMNNPLQTPMQSFFPQQMPGAPGRPGHHHQASIQLAAAGIHPPSFPTPVSGHFPRPSMALGPGGIPLAPPHHPFPHRNRRQPSIGGPPKAVLGGPARKLSPLPGGTSSPAIPAAPTPAPPKTKKVVVNLPKETLPGEGDEEPTRQPWARSPMPDVDMGAVTVVPVDISTAEEYPPEAERRGLPNLVDVYLPGKLAWDTIKKRAIEEKLEKLGVERGSGSNMPHIHAPHARAASISSPADPALLLFKLNKLQQTQEANSDNGSLSVSPQPPFAGINLGLSPSLSPGFRFGGNRHGHSMSMAQGPSYQPYSNSPSPFNPFGYNAISGSESVAESHMSDTSADPIYAPQGRVPMSVSNLAPPLSAVGTKPSANVDFIRGFGLETPLESEEEGEEDIQQNGVANDDSDKENQDITLEQQDVYASDADDGTTTVPQTRVHSRHVSKLSAALSLRSVGGNFHAQFQAATEKMKQEDEEEGDLADVERDTHSEGAVVKTEEVDPAGEWTGSEDLYLGLDTSDDESIGEWSNPSDEERARQQRVERRNRRRAIREDQPRRLPNFPRPPESAHGFFQRRDDDIISNPSEENLALGHRADFLGVVTEEYYEEDGLDTARDPHGLDVPPHHSRGPSSQYSLHDPAMAHSRHASDHYANQSLPTHQSSSSLGKRDLNPFAKPFVFGAPLGHPTWQSQPEPSMPMPVPVLNTSGSGSFHTHSRLPSIGKPLNIAAPEFKPGAFSFRLAGAPQMPEPEPAPSFPEPHHAEPMPMESSPFRVQGREKRQKLDPDTSIEEGDSMSSFKFPMRLETSSPSKLRHQRNDSYESADGDQDEEPVQPFTFAGFSAVANNMPIVPKESDAAEGDVLDDSVNTSGTTKGYDNGLENEDEENEVPQIGKIKRAPAPLHFNHPVSNNTVPAGLFKALVNNDERTRRRVKSRLNSGEFAFSSRRPSMDDDDVALIAHKTPLRLASDPERPTGFDDDVFGNSQHIRRPSSGSPRTMRRYLQRQSSLPDARVESRRIESVSPAAPSVRSVEPSARMSLQHLESVLAELLDEKLGELRIDLIAQNVRAEGEPSSALEGVAADVIASFRAELEQAAAEILKEARVSSIADVDFQAVRNMVQDGHQELLASLEKHLQHIQLPVSTSTTAYGHEHLTAVVEQNGSRTVKAVVEAIADLSARQEAVTTSATAREQDLMVERIVTALTPMVNALHTDPIDYAFLTEQLTQSVKPHISQLIDLASDKRETAGLILEQLLPHLPSTRDKSIDTDAISMQLIAEVRRAIAPIDAFEIKEQVADLVVERLDSRFAVRDKAFNVDTITSSVSESISGLFQGLKTVPSTLSTLEDTQKAIEGRQSSLSETQSQILLSLSNIPAEISSNIDKVVEHQREAFERLQHSSSSAEPDANILSIKDSVEVLSSEQKSLSEQHQLTLLQTQTIADKVNALPAEISGIVKGLESSLVDIVATKDSNQRELEELRKLNADAQVLLTKARGSFGQVRVEKDVLAEKLADVESERDRLRAQNKELQESASSQESERSALERRNAELEDALAKALARLQSVDVVTQAKDSSISSLEKSNAELRDEKQELKSKVMSLDQEVGFLIKEKTALSSALDSLQTKFDHILQQQDHWKALELATEKINLVHSLLENAENDEARELREYQDRSRAMEEKMFGLQAHNKELEKKLAANDNMIAVTRQTLTQAQQRSDEWERRAMESEGHLEMVRTQLEQAEQTHSQLDNDHTTVKMHLEELEARARLQQDKENKMRAEITALETKCSHLQLELEKSNASKRLAVSSPSPFRPQTGGPLQTPTRPDSRASTVYDARGAAANRRIPSYASTRNAPSPAAPVASVWDSMHAPSRSQWNSPSIHTPPNRYEAPATPKAAPAMLRNSYRAPSPTPSVVSNAPTQGEDGWWS